MAQLLAAKWTDPAASEDKRGAARRTLRLALPASSVQVATTNVVIHDLSELGFMIETSAELAVGETFQIDMPQAGLIEARVVWNQDSSFGCRFLSCVSKGAVSAAMLLAPIEQAAPADILPQAKSWSDFDDDNIAEDATYRGQTAAMVSLALLSIVVILFIFALLSLPFSSEQFSP
ncbi:MAG: PilZ domain-containing protein [Pseudomonadota bacterium]